MLRRIKVTKPTVFISALLTFLFLLSTLAVTVEGQTNLQVQTQQNTQNQGATTSVTVKERTQTQLKACQKKQAGINKRSQNLVLRGKLISNRFGKIVERVKQYYNNRLIPEGLTIENYDQMLANIEANKTTVKEALSAAEKAAQGFDCTSDDPKAQLNTFRVEMTNVIRALNVYKKSVINFLVAVRTKAKNIKSPSATP